jgi:hypothetical protein
LLFADLISLGIVSTVIGCVAAIYSFGIPLLNILLGLVGILFGLVSLRYDKEKTEKQFAWFGIILSPVSIIRNIFFSM